jgi:hypothetical protein
MSCKDVALRADVRVTVEGPLMWCVGQGAVSNEQSQYWSRWKTRRGRAALACIG